MESIVAQAVPMLEGSARPEGVEDDWIINFFNHARHIGDKEMQTLWARLLAGEATEPGSFSKRTVNMLRPLDKREAEVFANFCRFVWQIDGYAMCLVYETESSYLEPTLYVKSGITYDELSHLNSIGLTTLNTNSGFRKGTSLDSITVSYCGSVFSVNMQGLEDKSIERGFAVLNQAGRELAAITSPVPVEGFAEYVIARWRASGLDVTPSTTSP